MLGLMASERASCTQAFVPGDRKNRGLKYMMIATTHIPKTTNRIQSSGIPPESGNPTDIPERNITTSRERIIAMSISFSVPTNATRCLKYQNHSEF